MANLAKLMERASTYHRQGQWSDAERLYQEILSIDHRYAGALNLLGALYIQVNQLPKAIETLERALQATPDNPETLNNLGAALFRLDKHPEAIERFQQALKINPHYPEAHNNLGSSYSKLHDYDQAHRAFEEALKWRQNYPLAHYNLANNYQSLSQNQKAIAQYEEALRYNPRYYDALFNLGKILRDLGLFDQAIVHYERVRLLDPNHPQLLNNLGNLLRESGRPLDAIKHYEKALQVKTDYAEAHLNLGTALRDCGRHDEARAYYTKAIRLNPLLPEAYINLGTALQDTGEKAEALTNYEKALEIAPHSISATWNKSLLLLSLGHYEEGWRLHESGLGHTDKRGLDLFPIKRWHGEKLEGKRLLIWSEQGLGDSFQFIRYAPLCKQRGANVSVLCPEPLRLILETCPGIDKVVLEASVHDFDYHVPMMSLPFMFSTTLDTVPQSFPYIHVTDSYRQKWKSKFEAITDFKVGLVWAGNPREKLIHANFIDRRRSMDLAEFTPLFELNNCRFFNLQMGQASEQIKRYGLQDKLIDCMSDVHNFMDTAAIIENLDLVISVDTSVVHLAGAMQKPVWVLSRFDACWRWLGNRTTNPWYPTARVFGQPKLGDWTTVMKNVRAALLVASSTYP